MSIKQANTIDDDMLRAIDTATTAVVCVCYRFVHLKQCNYMELDNSIYINTLHWCTMIMKI